MQESSESLGGAGPTPRPTGHHLPNDPSSLADIPWYRRKRARTFFRRIFALVNAAVFFFAMAVLVHFVNEVEAEEARVRNIEEQEALQRQNAVDEGDRPPTTIPPMVLTDGQRYIRLGKAVFGSNFKAVMDTWFSMIIIVTFAGAAGAFLRQAKLLWIAVVLYVPAELFTFVAAIGISNHATDDEVKSDTPTRDKYHVAVAWSWVTFVLLVLLNGTAVLLARRMKTHKADRYRVTGMRRRRDGTPAQPGDKEEDLVYDDHDEGGTMISPLPRFTTDGSGPPRKRKQANRLNDGSNNVEDHSLDRAAWFDFAMPQLPARRKPTTLSPERIKEAVKACSVASVPQPGSTVAEVHHVYDGDTLTLSTRERVRLIGVDTPEISRFEAFAEEARAFSKQWLHGRRVYLYQPPELDTNGSFAGSGSNNNPSSGSSPTSPAAGTAKPAGRAVFGNANASRGNDTFFADVHGRRWAVIFVSLNSSPPTASSGSAEGGQAELDGRGGYLNVNEALLYLGYAHFFNPLADGAELPFQDRFLDVQRDARRARRGLWSLFNDSDAVWAEGSGIYHVASPRPGAPQCDAGRRLASKATKSAEVHAGNAAKALDGGYAPCRECHGTKDR